MISSPIDKPQPTRRAVATALIASGALASCASPALFMRNARAVARPLLGGGATKGFTREQVAQYSAASVELRVGGGVPQLLLLARVDGRDHLWGLNGQIVLQTRGGRLAATGGLTADLLRTEALTSDPAESSLLSSEHARGIRLLDFSDDYGMGCQAKSQFHVAGSETLEILGARLVTRRIVERVRVDKIGWRHTNIFWADAENGMVWKSRQYAHPEVDALTITTTRPANV